MNEELFVDGGKYGLDLLLELKKVSKNLKTGDYYSPAVYQYWWFDEKGEKKWFRGFTHSSIFYRYKHACHGDLMTGGKKTVILNSLDSHRYSGPAKEANKYWRWLLGMEKNLRPPYPHVLKHMIKVYLDADKNPIGFLLNMSDCNHAAVRHFLILSRGPHEMYRTVRAWNLLVDGGIDPVFALNIAHNAVIVRRRGKRTKDDWQVVLGINTNGHIYMPCFDGTNMLKSLDLEDVHNPDGPMYANHRRGEIINPLRKRPNKEEVEAINAFKKNFKKLRGKSASRTIQIPVVFGGELWVSANIFYFPKDEKEKEKKKAPDVVRLVEAARILQKELYNVAC